MSGKLATFVHVADDTGAMHVFGPDDKVPAWAASKITNPMAWKGGKVADPADEITRLRARLAELEKGQAKEPTPAPPDAKPAASGIPPKGGAGSGAPAWREYAVSKGVEVSADASRDDVIAALDAAGIPTE